MIRRSRHAGLAAALLPLAFALVSLPAAAARQLWLAAPGTPAVDLHGSGWHAIVLDGTHLVVAPVTGTRPADGRTASAKTEADLPRLAAADFQPEGPALDLPPGALFAAQATDDDATTRGVLPYPPGRHPSLLDAPARLRPGWSATVRLGGGPVTVSARGPLRPDGVPLDGGLALYTSAAGKDATVLLPPAHGTGYALQELLWLGDANGDGLADVIVRRVAPSGQVDHAVVFGGLVASASIDPDHPATAFSSGADEAENPETAAIGVWRHAGDTRPLPPPRFGTAAFTVSSETWFAATAGPPALPARFVDRQLDLASERLRFTLDYQPLAGYDAALGSSAPEGAHHLGPVLVRVHFRQRTQVLMQAADPDGAPLRVQVDQLGGQPAIAIDYQPHYNNQYRITWLWNPATGRFERSFIRHSQGC
ncbi:hypothetical protein [Piscinibacter gummiphilus]|uniref:hypothetical protein n=1 Tax=Piscinibacter gummiphilus TaxID=946333 RepID=UPI0012F50291|nr:hypothetical protein [Piscinibacter gummiphilus]GLS94167.1 hypothetical protein GCM10007918_14590 [Piscinibacter gummiphilus]